MKDFNFYLVWKDLHEEIDVDSLYLLKEFYSSIPVQKLADLIKHLVYKKKEDIAARNAVYISNSEPVFSGIDHVIYCGVAGEMDYKEFLLSLAVMINFTNSLDHVQFIISVAKKLRSFDRDICDLFVKDIAEEIYHYAKHR
ncbi:hypothetical protein C6W24_03975 [Bacillus atrophaeus]|uniref:hypothetical protein n=1 Tax=Bacillus atrophaeus TaxID=1452 RepID=UPI000D026938|nr:hypothetical protein [Bacillus atrophaeus]PRS03110.1 hypothetical protein C6W24_03975 [Bacillus atrophaeus]